MKKTFRIFITLLLILSLISPPSVYAVDAVFDAENSNYVKIHGGDNYQQQLNEGRLQIIESVPVPDSRGWGVACSPTPPNYQQINGYYCGPACLQIVLKHITGMEYSQSYLASQANTTQADGTYVYKMSNVLNYIPSDYTYAYTLISSISALSGRLESSFSANAPVIFHARTGSLAVYNGTNLGHYLVGHTIFQAAQPEAQVIYNDPYYANYGSGSVYGTHTDTISAFYDALTKWGSRYLIYGTRS